MKTFEDYLKDNLTIGIDFRVRVTSIDNGRVQFYIHVSGESSETLNANCIGNEIIPEFISNEMDF